MISSLFDVAYVLQHRRDLSAGSRLSLIWQFWFFSFKNKWTKPEGNAKFMGLLFWFRTYQNLHTILKEVFFFGEYVPKGQTETPFIIDCGGNIGVTTLYFKMIMPKASILVFEPSTENFQCLEKNIQSNRLQDVKAIRAAVCDHEGDITFWDDPKKPGSATSTQAVANTKGDERFRMESVPAVKLSHFIDRPVDVLKMDIEGGEGIVLRELDQSGKLALISEIIFEYHVNSSNKENKLTDIVEILERHGFRITPFGIDLSKDVGRIASRPFHHFMIRASKQSDTRA